MFRVARRQLLAWCLVPAGFVLARPTCAQYHQRIDPFSIPDRAAYDSHRGCFVAQAFVQDQWETWELHGSDWLWRQTAGGQPGARFGFLYFDAARRRTVALETSIGPLTSEYWEWDGIEWFQMSAAVAPVPRYDAAFAHDRVRNVVTMVGGKERRGTYLPEHWEWNGTDWIQVGVTAPPVRSRAAMCADPVGGQLVLFGGFDANAAIINETWTYDGTTWTQRFVPGPSPRFDASLAFDPTRGCVVLCGGSDSFGNTLADEWEWDGQSWNLVTTSTPPGPIGGPNILSLSGLYLPSKQPFLETPAGIAYLSLLDFGALWTRNASGWTRTHAERVPTLRRGEGFVFDRARGEAVLFGGSMSQNTSPTFDDTWAWNGSWRRLRPGQAPPARMEHGMAFDAVRNEVVLFGGIAGSVRYGDTWVWDGNNWSQRQPASAPTPRNACSMTGHAAAGRVVLHGGISPGVFHVDTWTWDGTNWQQVAASGGPSARTRETLVEDRSRGVVVLAGGLVGGFLPRNDTWEWDGVTWQQRAATGATATGVAYYDASVGRVVRFSHDRREWNGAAWTVVATPEPLPPVISGRAVYDERRQRGVLLGREAGSSSALTVVGSTPARVELVGTGCGSPAPRLTVAGRGRIGEPGLHLAADVTQASAPAIVFFGWSGQGGIVAGCQVLVQGVVGGIALVGDAFGYGRVALQIPANAALLGLEVHLQMAARVTGGPVLGHALSNGVRLQLGD